MPTENAFSTAILAQGRLACVVKEICVVLGYEETNRANASETPHYSEIFDPKNLGHVIGLHVGFPYGHVSISPRFQYRNAAGTKDVWYLPYKAKHPSIRATLSKTGAQIAADIKRRLLPDCIPLWESNQTAIKNYAESDASILTSVKRLAGVIGAPLPKVGETRDEGRVHLYHSTCLPESLGELRVGSDGEVKIDGVYVSLAEAEAILRLLVNLRLGKK